MTLKKPFDDTRLAQYMERRILELKPRKTQAEIAAQAGFANASTCAPSRPGHRPEKVSGNGESVRSFVYD